MEEGSVCKLLDGLEGGLRPQVKISGLKDRKRSWDGEGVARTETPRAGNSAQPHSTNGSGELLHRTEDGEDGR